MAALLVQACTCTGMQHGIGWQEDAGVLRARARAITLFLKQHEWLTSTHVTDFYTESLWERLPHEVLICVCCLAFNSFLIWPLSYRDALALCPSFVDCGRVLVCVCAYPHVGVNYLHVYTHVDGNPNACVLVQIQMYLCCCVLAKIQMCACGYEYIPLSVCECPWNVCVRVRVYEPRIHVSGAVCMHIAPSL